MPILYDPYGREIREVMKKPMLDIIGAVKVRDQFSTYPSVKLTPEKLGSLLREADAGHILRQAELFEEMEEKDPDLASLFQTRKLAVQALDLEISPASDSREDKKLAEFVKENLEDLDMDDAILDLLDAVAKGCAFAEIDWRMDGSSVAVGGLEWIHQKRFTFAELSAGWQTPLPKAPKLLTEANSIHGEDIPPWKIVYHRYKGRSGFAQRAGLMRVVAYYYLFKNYAIKDWVVFLEKFGQPLRVGKFQPGAGDEDKKILREALVNLGTDAAAMISDTTILELLENTTASMSSDMFAAATEFFNKSYAKAILGQTATTEGTPGALGEGKERGEVRRDLVKADANALAKTLRDQLVWPLIGFNFGWDKALPSIKFHIDDPENLGETATTHKALVEMGTPIPLSFIRKKYGIPEPLGDEPVLERQAPPEPFNGVGANNYSPVPGAIRESPFGAIKKKVPIGSRLV